MTEVQTYFKEEKKPPRRRARNSTLPAARPKKRPKTSTGVTRELRAQVFNRAGGRCQADGVHHPNCPGQLNPAADWVPHHIQPRSKGGPDTLENLMAVWCPMGLGLNGCHGRSHSAEGERLGYLRRGDT